MKKILFILLLFLPILLFSQELEELKKIGAKENTAKSWNDVAEEYRLEKDTAGMRIALSNVMKTLKRDSLYFENIGRYYLYESDYERLIKDKYIPSYIEKKNKAIAYFQRAINSSYITLAYHDIGQYYNSIGQLDSALVYLHRSADEKCTRVAAVYCDIAYVHFLKKDNDSIKAYAQKAIESAISKKDTICISTGYQYLALVAQSENQLEESIKYYEEVILLNEKTKKWEASVTTLTNLSVSYRTRGHTEEALKFGQRALEIALKHKLPKSSYAFPYYAIANVFQSKKEFEVAIMYYREMMNSNPNYKVSFAGQLGILSSYYALGNMDSTKFYMKELESDFQKKQLTNSSDYLRLKGSFSFVEEKYEDAIFYLRKYEEKIKTKGEGAAKLLQLYKELSHSYERGPRDYKKALEYRQMELLQQDSLFAKQSNDALTEYYTKYQTAEKELEISKLNEDKQEMIFNRTLIIGGFLILTVFLALAFLYNRYKRLKTEKEAAILTSRMEQKELEFQAFEKDAELKQMKNYLEGLETERSRLAKELHDNVANQLYIMDMNIKKEMDVPESVSATIQDMYTQVRNISHELMPPMFQYASLEEILSSYLGTLEEQTNIKFHLNIKNEALFSNLPAALSHELYRIVQECTGNIIKHSNAKKASISLTYQDEEIQLTIEDDGEGFDTSVKNKGIGLHIIEDRCRGLEGQIQIKSGKGSGCKIEVRLPFTLQAGDELL